MAPWFTSMILACHAFGADAPRFEPQTIDRSVGEVCYALAAADVNCDGRLDIAAATERGLYWYANPGWQRHVIVEGGTEPDNVCLEAADIDVDGRIDFAVGTGWGPLGLRGTEKLVWVSRPTGSERWAIHTVAAVPSLHRIRIGDVGGQEGARLLAVPLQGR